MSPPPTNPALSHEAIPIHAVEVAPIPNQEASKYITTTERAEPVNNADLTDPIVNQDDMKAVENSSPVQEPQGSVCEGGHVKNDTSDIIAPIEHVQALASGTSLQGQNDTNAEAQTPTNLAKSTVQDSKEDESAQGKPLVEPKEEAETSASPTGSREPSPTRGEKHILSSPSPPPPPPKDDKYLQSNLEIPLHPWFPTSRLKDKSPVIGENNGEEEFNDKYESTGNEVGETFEESRSEIQSIMEQFGDGMPAPGLEEIMSPRLEIAGPKLSSPVHPPRKSSLEPLTAGMLPGSPGSPTALHSPPPRSSSLAGVGLPEKIDEKAPTTDQPSSPSSPNSIFKPQPPQPDPEPDLPFDFHRFLEQLRHRTADPVAKFLRSFLSEFGKKPWMVHEQVKIISDFLEFITKKMAQCEVWRTVSEQEFDNAREGMEKLVMNRLYTQTFSPAIPPLEPEPSGKGRRRGPQSTTKPGRRGQHQEDVERDEVLAQKVRIYKWVREEHLDIKPVGEKGKKFLLLAQQELLKIRSYRAPRDKVICILNCCKVIFGFLKSSQKDQSADAFVPLLIYVVLQANPDHLVSNVQYILRFRNQDKLSGEAGYYISSLMGAIQFIENLDRTSLTISDKEFEQNVEAAVSAIAERPQPSVAEASSSLPPASNELPQRTQTPQGHRRLPSPHNGLPISEKSALSRPEVTPRNSLDAEQAGPRRSTSLKTVGNSSGQQEGEYEDNDAVKGLLRTIQRPLTTIGRIFSDSESSPASQPVRTPQPGNTPRLSPAPPAIQQNNSEDPRFSGEQSHTSTLLSGDIDTTIPPVSSRDLQVIQRMSAEDAAARQASAEAEEARRIQRREHKVVVDTLAGMFPNLDREIIDDVVRMKEGRVGLAVDACLALTNP